MGIISGTDNDDDNDAHNTAMSQQPPAQRSSHLDLAPPSTAMTYESFKPKFPLDPFTGVNANSNSKHDNSEAMKGNESTSARPPWTVDVERLPTLPFLRAERRVVLILGGALCFASICFRGVADNHVV